MTPNTKAEKTLIPKKHRWITKAVKKVVKDYGQVLRRLGHE